MSTLKPYHAVVTTPHRDIWYGLVVDEGHHVVVIEQSRHCYQYTSDMAQTEGLSGLSVHGPGPNAKIGAAAPSTRLRDVVSVTECTERAVARFAATGVGRSTRTWQSG